MLGENTLVLKPIEYFTNLRWNNMTDFGDLNRMDRDRTAVAYITYGQVFHKVLL